MHLSTGSIDVTALVARTEDNIYRGHKRKSDAAMLFDENTLKKRSKTVEEGQTPAPDDNVATLPTSTHIMNKQSTGTPTAGGHHGPFHSPVSDDSIASCIQERFMTDNIYTKISTSAHCHQPAQISEKQVAENPKAVDYHQSSPRAECASPERQHLHLLDKGVYCYLGSQSSIGTRLKVALKTIGLSKRHVAQTCQLVTAILHLGNLEFMVDRSRNEDAAIMRNMDILEIIADFLGVQLYALEAALAYKTKLFKELCTVFLDPDEPTIGEKEEDEPATTGGPPCITGEFRSALDTLFKTLNETQAWFVFCINPNDSQLLNQLEGHDTGEQKRIRMRDTEAAAGVKHCKTNDPYPMLGQPSEESPFGLQFGENDQSNQVLSLVANTSPFQRADIYNDDYEDHRSFRSEDYDGRSRYTTHQEVSISNFGTESYTPSRNMSQNANKKGFHDKEVLVGEIQEGETTEVMKETSSHRKWVALCWMLTFWVPSILLKWWGRMK
ncbi:hypothetical protein PILCRDRAFT_85409 [Piloderma croceum F 1598]|uniref:Myosin motor domain-containing protein n=1 Tax=Piloderma croceum (strain F 1598) TaxID=765440 RepID=A0A0C3G8L2_PILCF|nr:hypothetical protein PILCRDRAFT_85409 [Piloderma croceum F 1598]